MYSLLFSKTYFIHIGKKKQAEQILKIRSVAPVKGNSRMLGFTIAHER